jgi:hypothetical protein
MRAYAWIAWALACSCVTAVAARDIVSQPVVPADPDAAGKELVVRLLELQPAEGMTNSAMLTNTIKRKLQFVVPLRIDVSVTESNWTTCYAQLGTNGNVEKRFIVVRSPAGANDYFVESITNGFTAKQELRGPDAAVPIAGSDFTLADVGMEFLRWPTQRLLSKEICRSQSCDKLESLAPPGWTNEYVRVVSWFDIDTGGPVLVEAFNAAGKLVKEFKPNDFKKVNGQWQVEEIEISNPQTGSRSTIRFELGGK